MRGVFGAAYAFFLREIYQYWRLKNRIAIPLLFFFLSLTVMGLVISMKVAQFEGIFPAMLCLFAAFSFFLSFDNLLKPDYQDGSVHQMILADQSLVFFTFIQSITHWLVIGVPLSCAALGAMVIIGVPFAGWGGGILVFLIGTAIFSLTGMMGAAFTTHSSVSPHLPILLIFPFYLPALLFMILCLEAVFVQSWDRSSFLLLLSLLGVMSVFSPVISGWALRLSLYE